MSDRLLARVMLGLTAIGLGIATYLTVVHYTGGSPVCAISHGCEIVQHSSYAKLAGIPVAVIGLAGYVVIFAALLVPASDDTRLAIVAMTIVGFAFSAYLTYRELFTIDAICQWCVGSAVVMTGLAGLAVTRFLRGGDAPPRAGAPDVDEALAPAAGQQTPMAPAGHV